jgi:ribose transport system substrate-binding protein
VRRYRRLAGAGIAAILLITACGSDNSGGAKATTAPGSTQTSSTVAGSAPPRGGTWLPPPSRGANDDAAKLAEARKLAEQYEVDATKVSSEKLGPVKAPKGISVFFVSCPQTIAGCVTNLKGAKEAAVAAGAKFQSCEVATGTVEEFQACMDQAVQAKPDYIINNSTSPDQAPGAYADAHKAGIPIIGQFSGLKPDPAKGNTFEAGFMSEEMGARIADAIIADSKGQAHLLQMVDTIYPHSAQFEKGIANEFGRLCPKCKVESLKYEANASMSQVVPGLIQTALQTKPDINWVFCGAVAFTGVMAADAIRQAGRIGQVFVASFNAEPPNLELLKKGDIAKFDITIGTPEISYVAMDLIVRDAAGSPVKDRILNPTYKIMTPQQPDKYEGPKGFRDRYKQLWGVS